VETISTAASDSVREQLGPADMVIIFSLHQELYGLPAREVLTVVRPLPITPVPHAQAYVEGVVNLRGEIVPIVDLRRHFGLPRSPISEDTRFVVTAPGDFKVAIIADAVSGVTAIPWAAVHRSGGEAPLSDDVVRGVVQHEGRLLTILDLDSLLGQGRRRYPDFPDR